MTYLFFSSFHPTQKMQRLAEEYTSNDNKSSRAKKCPSLANFCLPPAMCDPILHSLIFWAEIFSHNNRILTTTILELKVSFFKVLQKILFMKIFVTR